MKFIKETFDSLRPASIILLVIIIVAVAAIVFTVKSKQEPASAPALEKKIKTRKPEVKVPEIKFRGQVAIIVDDFGYNFDHVTQAFLDLDAQLTYAVIPGHHYSRKFAGDASAAGYEVIIHMPMETMAGLKGEDGYILKSEMTGSEIERRMNLAIENFPSAKGMNNHQGSKASADRRLMTIVGSVLKQTGLYFIDSRTSSETVAEETVRSLGVPTGRRAVFLDNDSDKALIKKQLQKLVDLAEKNGLAVGIGHGRQSTLEVFQEEIPRFQADGFQFIFASEAVK